MEYIELFVLGEGEKHIYVSILSTPPSSSHLVVMPDMTFSCILGFLEPTHSTICINQIIYFRASLGWDWRVSRALFFLHAWLSCKNLLGVVEQQLISITASQFLLLSSLIWCHFPPLLTLPCCAFSPIRLQIIWDRYYTYLYVFYGAQTQWSNMCLLVHPRIS